MRDTNFMNEKTNKSLPIGFILALISLFISFYGLLSLIALIFCFVTMSQEEKGSKKYNFSLFGLGMALFSLIYAYLTFSL